MEKLKIMLVVLFVGTITSALAWGFWGHQKINNKACFTLPEELFGFYKANIDFITIHAVDPDKRRYSDPEEAPRHFIDLDRYGEHPFDSLPRYWKDAVAKYGEDTLKAHGIVAWHIPLMLSRLTQAFKERNYERILKLSAELGHYVGDAHVPLHCTRNYNGQLTGQHGIHGFWESRIPETYGDNYDFLVGKAIYINNPSEYTWNILRASYSAHDSVLNLEKELNSKFPADRKYAFEEKGNQLVKVYSLEYTKAYNALLLGMVERRMQEATLAVGSFWYTAWVNAGMPDLNTTTNYTMSDQMQIELDELNKSFELKKNKTGIKGHDD